MNGAFGLGDKEAMKILVAVALYQGQSAGTCGGLYEGEPSQIGDIHAVARDGLDDRGVVCWHGKLDPCAGLFFQVSDKGLAVADNLSRVGCGNHAETQQRTRVGLRVRAT